MIDEREEKQLNDFRVITECSKNNFKNKNIHCITAGHIVSNGTTFHTPLYSTILNFNIKTMRFFWHFICFR